MIVSDTPDEARKKLPVKNQGTGIITRVSDLFGKAKEGLSGLISDEDSEIK
jgi:hypothetical protein